MLKKFTFPVVFFVFIALLLSGLPAQRAEASPDWWDTDWQYRIKLTIDEADVDSELSDFPVLVHLSSSCGKGVSDLSGIFNGNTQDNGEDIRFTDSEDPPTLLNHEIEEWDNSGAEAWIWVNIPTISSDSDTEFYIYYGNPVASDGQNPTAVWDGNFTMVQHLKDNPDNANTQDSTSNNNDGTKKGADNPIEADGKIDKAQDFSSDHVSCGDLGIGDNYTAECWIKADTLTGSGDYNTYGFTIMASSILGQGYPLWLAVRGTEVRLWAYESSSVGWHQTAGAGLNTGIWFHIVAAATKGGATKVYVNSVEKLSFTNDGEVVWCNIFTLGDLRPARKIYFDGIIDEVRISDIARSADWIEAQYLSMTDNFITFGSEERRPRAGRSTKDKYRTNEDVYVTASGFLSNSDVDVYVVDDKAWSDGEEIGAYVEMDNFTVDGNGDIGPEEIWSAPLGVGEYDVVFDADQNGDYDEASDLVDNPNHPGFVVVSTTVGGEVHPVDKAAILLPWLGLGAILILAAGGLILLKRRNHK